jgi:pantothenate kinase-related protein Tda10
MPIEEEEESKGGSKLMFAYKFFQTEKSGTPLMRACAGPQGRKKSLFDIVLGENMRLLNISKGIFNSLFQASCQSYPVT